MSKNTKNQKNINLQLTKAILTSTLNVSSFDTLVLLKNLDDRVNTGKTNLERDCSFQVCNAYYLYLDFLFFLDFEQFKKFKRC